MAAEVLDPVVGDPLEVSAAARTLESIALDVANIGGRLRALAAGDHNWTGTAALAARARSATLPPKLDKAQVSYAAAGGALRSYARMLDDAQHQSGTAIASAARATADLAAAQEAQTAAARRDAEAASAASAGGMPPPVPTAPRYDASIDDALSRLRRAGALNDEAHELQRQAARVTAAALHEASHAGIHNQSWLHHVTHAVGHWASTHWTSALREVSKVATIVSALAGAAALILAVAGVLFPPLEAAAAVLETVSLVSAVVAGAADTTLAVSGKGSWTAVGVDALTLVPAGLGRVVTKAAPLLRESRLIKPSTVVHASEGDAGRVIGEAHGARLAYPGGLGANDVLGGHVLTHVGLDDTRLAARGLPLASTFNDRTTAEHALADLQSAHADEIRVWVEGARRGTRALFGATFDEPVGRILLRGQPKAFSGTTAVAVLRADPSAPLGYFIMTGFVAP